MGDKVDEGYRAVSFTSRREHVEQTLEQIVDVLVSLDARLSQWIPPVGWTLVYAAVRDGSGRV